MRLVQSMLFSWLVEQRRRYRIWYFQSVRQAMRLLFQEMFIKVVLCQDLVQVKMRNFSPF